MSETITPQYARRPRRASRGKIRRSMPSCRNDSSRPENGDFCQKWHKWSKTVENGRKAPGSQQPEAPEARMALAADHQVVVDREAERLGGLADLARHLDVVA